MRFANPKVAKINNCIFTPEVKLFFSKIRSNFNTMTRPAVLLLILLALFVQNCDSLSKSRMEKQVNENSPEKDASSVVMRNGKIKGAQALPNVLTHRELDTFGLPFMDEKLVAGLQHQLRLLRTYRQSSNWNIGGQRITKSQLENTVRMLLEWQYTFPTDLQNQLDAYQLRGEDGRGNVYFTGYFTPVINAKEAPDEKFKYPIYGRPENWIGPLPSRKEIEGKKQILNNRNLEIAFADNPVDIYFMQVQGSGFVKFPNKKTTYLAFDGTNRHPYRSISKYITRNKMMPPESDLTMETIKNFLDENLHLRDSVLQQNPSYTFFRKKGGRPLGAGNVQLTEDYSIAVDKRYIPLGSVLLAAIPEFDKSGNCIGHQYRFLLAQDVGGQIGGPGHIDLYCGVGKEAQIKASQFHHYGRLWILLPKEQT